jgi:ribosome maturation factor RimP
MDLLLHKRIEKLIGPSLTHMGYDIVRIAISGGKRPTVQIMAERDDGSLNIDDCEEISKTVSALFDVNELMDGAFTLEVSSPGLDRPLTKPHHFERYQGELARIELEQAVDNRKRFTGIIKGLKDGHIILNSEDGELALPFADLAKARLIMEDTDLRSALNKEKKKQAAKKAERKKERFERIEGRKKPKEKA